MMCEAPACCSSDVFERLATAMKVLMPRICVARRVKRRGVLWAVTELAGNSIEWTLRRKEIEAELEKHVMVSRRASLSIP